MKRKFAAAVDDCRTLAKWRRPGLRAIKRQDQDRVAAARPRQLSGSVDIDDALMQAHPRDPRWDYAVGCSAPSGSGDVVHWIEVHPCNDGEVRVVERKLAWLKSWLKLNAPALTALPAEYRWVSSGPTGLSPGSPSRRRLAQAGLYVAGSRYEID
ncbi:MAG: hypothetical protein ACOYN0_05190 [Phycisphaerales bacterium]